MTRPPTRRRPVKTRLRVPIAVKLAVFLAALIVASSAWQTTTAIRTASAHLEDEINASGVHLVKSLSILIRPEWFRDLRTQDEVIEILRKFRADSGTQRIEQIVIQDSSGDAIALLTQRIAASEPRPVDYPAAQRANVTVADLEANGEPVRSFRTDVYEWVSPVAGGSSHANPIPGPRLGSVSVYLRSASIRSARDDLSDELLVVSALGAVGATLASFLLAAFLTRSIRVLARDLAIAGQGDLEHQTDVDSGDEVGDLGRAFNRMTADLLAAQDAKIRQRALEHELGVATRIQQALLPESTPRIDGLEIGVHYSSAKEVGGDYYDFVPIDEHRVGIVIADVSGKGVPGSLVMTMTRSMLRVAAKNEPSARATIERLNHTLAPDLNPGMFVTLVYAVVDRRTREVELARAGHNAPLFWSASQKRLGRLSPGGIAVGLDREGAIFRRELETRRLRMGPGDVLVIYTDGVTEAKSPAAADFGDDQLAQTVGQHRGEAAGSIVRAVVDRVGRHVADAEPSDDITLLVLRGL